VNEWVLGNREHGLDWTKVAPEWIAHLFRARMNGTDRLELPSDLHSSTRAFASAFLFFLFISFLGKEEEIQLCLRVPRMNLRFFPRTRRHELNNSYQATGIVNGKKELVRLSLVKQYALLTWGEWRSWLIEGQLAKRRGTPFVGNYWIAYLTVERNGTGRETRVVGYPISLLSVSTKKTFRYR
jgi:hypothetical protein